jgi:hypothetical protein
VIASLEFSDEASSIVPVRVSKGVVALHSILSSGLRAAPQSSMTSPRLHQRTFIEASKPRIAGAGRLSIQDG